MKYVIIGGVAGGMSAATRLRRLDETAEIVVYERGPFVSFANCGLPFYLGGEITERADLIVKTAAQLQDRFNITIHPNHTVTKIMPATQQLTVTHDETATTVSYDKLILSTGATPIVPDLPGLTESDNIFTLRNIPDLDKIMAEIQSNASQHALVVGGGFIGLEVAEGLRHRGLQVTLVEQAPHVLPPLDEEMAAPLKTELENNGVHGITGQAVTAFDQAGHQATLADGTVLHPDFTIMAIGVRPASQLAKDAHLTLGWRDGIVVDEHYQTSDPNIYAIGDAILVTQQIDHQPALIALASPANRQGRQVADNLAGHPRRNRGSIGTAIVRVFDLTAAATGLNERDLQREHLPYQVVHTRTASHASYYPGSEPITLKLLFNPDTGKIYGAQGVGKIGVDKRLDILATAIKGQLTIADLPELELTYAPPYGAAKDPVNMLGYAALNLAEGLSHNIQWYDLPAELAAGKQLLDVRDADELADGRFKNAINIPLDQLRDRLSELNPHQAYIVSCFSGQRSYMAERILKQHGFAVENLDGAFALYAAVRPEDLVGLK
ncbi:FAD-dependent oxidoreductase [Lactiplantibacillus fabifermentans]|uniref:CoA-disulfide reductase n=1 Tax=Lactiplantibacillus fabifermentans T30PCM01 TaxID=1400520 RepID=W6TBH6_9LACO|nr:FAD-dependent oxidoreductase [Lactiplantibacillus fabifermentans]ETY72655.1 CoA-disulfide reductase [Lactiplantibacillus fabifermentans T30PCM01]